MQKLRNFFDKQTFITYSVLIIVLFLDQISKQMIINNFPITVDIPARTFSNSTPYQIFPDFYLLHVVNFGAAFSIFYGKTFPLILFVLLIVTSIFVYERNTYKKRPVLLSVGLGFIIAGALGNLADRIRLGYVTDFFALIYQGKLIWPIFNVADISVNTGVGLLILSFFLQELKMKKERQAAAPKDLPATQDSPEP